MEEKRDARGLTEAEAIARYRSRNYPKPALTADIVVFSPSESGLRVLLIERGGHPFIGRLAFPGGFADENEPVEETARRELEEETGVQGLEAQLVGLFSKPGRDPRGWVVSAVFAAVVEGGKLELRAGDDAASARWYPVRKMPDGWAVEREGQLIPAQELAFDHGEILNCALTRLGLG